VDSVIIAMLQIVILVSQIIHTYAQAAVMDILDNLMELIAL